MLSTLLCTFRVSYWLEKVADWGLYIIIFYVATFIIFSLIIGFVYIAYQQHNNHSWLLKLIQMACFLMITILFIPLLEILLMMSNCKSAKQTMTHMVFPSMVCYEGIHILHVTLSFLAALILITNNTVIIKCMYEVKEGR